MRARTVVYLVELVSSDGVRLEMSDEGWHVRNIRQLSEPQKRAALELIERAAAHAERTPAETLGDQPLLARAEYAAHRLRLRITHRRTKRFEF
jgi:hypothetical protein